MKKSSAKGSSMLTRMSVPKVEERSRGAVTLYLDKQLFSEFKATLKKKLNRSPSEMIEALMKDFIEGQLR